jgi:hypothetical protein
MEVKFVCLYSKQNPFRRTFELCPKNLLFQDNQQEDCQGRPTADVSANPVS